MCWCLIEWKVYPTNRTTRSKEGQFDNPWDHEVLLSLALMKMFTHVTILTTGYKYSQMVILMYLSKDKAGNRNERISMLKKWARE